MGAYFGQGTGQIVLDNVQCIGSENQLLSCNSAPILDVSSSCEHSDDAGVRCEGIYLQSQHYKFFGTNCVLNTMTLIY